MADNLQVVGDVVYRVIATLENTKGTPKYKETLAEIRKTIKRPIYHAPRVIELLVQGLPDSMIGKGDELTPEEWAVLHTIQIYTILQQGNKKIGNSNTRDSIGSNLGSVKDEALTRRFNQLVKSKSAETFIYRLRQLMNIYKGKGTGTLNYQQLSRDLWLVKRGYDDSVKVQWAKDFYKGE